MPPRALATGMVLTPERVCGYPFHKSSPEDRRGNFSEVQLPLTEEEAMAEADRCVRCGTPVCIDVCPLNTDIRGMCDAVAAGDFKAAYRRLRETNALLGTTARCCPQLQGLCEEACNVGSQGQPIAIGVVQRFVADWERTKSRQPDPVMVDETGRKVAVIGGGPAGLAAAELLRRYGHSVTIYEELPVLGGTARYAIPDYHLPKDVLEYEVGRIIGMGVSAKTGVKVGEDVTLDELRSEFDAVLLASGARDVPKFDTPGSELNGIYDGYEFLESVFLADQDAKDIKKGFRLGDRVLVIGGGNSALDCARTALRLTNGKVTMLYRRTEAEMPADPILVQEGMEEGLELEFLVAPKSYNGNEGSVTSATLSVMRLGPLDSSGRRSPEPTGEEVEVECDSVLIAIGRGPDSFLSKAFGLKVGRKNAIAVDDHFMTSTPGVYATGDVVNGETLVVRAMAAGREAAERIHGDLVGLKEHVSLYDFYYTRRATGKYYVQMLDGRLDSFPPR